MAKLLPLAAAIVSLAAPGCAFVAPGPVRANDVRLDAKLEGREIEGALTPTNNFVLVKVAEIEDETEGGILLTGSVSGRKLLLRRGCFAPLIPAAHDVCCKCMH